MRIKDNEVDMKYKWMIYVTLEDDLREFVINKILSCILMPQITLIISVSKTILSSSSHITHMC